VALNNGIKLDHAEKLKADADTVAVVRHSLRRPLRRGSLPPNPGARSTFDS
jgi:hypothetical protein